MVRHSSRFLFLRPPLLCVILWAVAGLVGAGLAGAQRVVAQLPDPAVSLTMTGDLHALTRAGELWNLAGTPVRLAAGLSTDAPLTSCAGQVAATLRGGQLWWGQRRAAGNLSVSAGTLCTPSGELLAISRAGEALLISRAGTVSRRMPVAALPDARPHLADLNGDGRPWVVLLTRPTTRYAHGVLGDAVEAAGLVALDPVSLAVRATLTLPAPLVFEDWEARPLRVAGRDVLAVVRASPQGGGALTVVGLQGGTLRVLAAGPDFGRGGRWLAPLTDGADLYAVHTPHLGGALHRYALTGTRLTAAPVTGSPLVSNHRLGERLVTGGVWQGGVWLGTQEQTRTLGPDGLTLPAAPSSAVLASARGAFLGTQDGRVWQLPDRQAP